MSADDNTMTSFTQTKFESDFSNMMTRQFPEMSELEWKFVTFRISQATISLDRILAGRSNLRELCKAVGLNKILSTEEKRVERFLDALEHFVVKNYLISNSLNYNQEFEEEEVKELTGNIETTINDPNVNLSIGLPMDIARASTNPGTKTREMNYRIQPTLTKRYISGDKMVDEFIHQSLILNSIFLRNIKYSRFQELQMRCLAKHLVSKSEHIFRISNLSHSTVFSINGQKRFTDYLRNFARNNEKILESFHCDNFIPFMVELNGIAGVGKSTFVDMLAKVFHEVFPFFHQDELVYSRVNDKFWNGYCQQPIVVYDDANQNDKMLYNLDNEIIQIGGGKFTYPPMAFEKNTKFSSLFVVFTTNQKLIETTRADKGAIERRIFSYDVVPKSETGKQIILDFGIKWVYNSKVRQTSNNLRFSGEGPMTIMAEFFHFMGKQIHEVIEETEFDEFFEEINDEEPRQIVEEIYSFLNENGLDNHTQMKIINSLMKEQKLQEAKTLSQVEQEKQIIKHDTIKNEYKSVEAHLNELESREVKDITSFVELAVKVENSPKCQFWNPSRYHDMCQILTEYYDKMDVGTCIRLNKDSMVQGHDLYFIKRDGILTGLYMKDMQVRGDVTFYRHAVYRTLYSTCLPNFITEESTNIINAFLEKRLVNKSILQDKLRLLRLEIAALKMC